VMMYGRNGGIEVADIDAIANAHRFPQEWTLKAWIRPDGRPDVFIRTDWDQMSVVERVAIARSTVIEGRGGEITNAAQADQAISEFLAGTKHPGEATS
jgi:hypothetical protein